MDNNAILCNALAVNRPAVLTPQTVLGLNSRLWKGTGISSFTEACLQSHATNTARSRIAFPAYPEMRMYVKGTMTSTSFLIATAETGGDGYKLSFPSTTSAKLERLDSGSATEIITGTLPTALTATDWIAIVIRILADRIEVEVDGTMIIGVDTTHRLTTWYLYLIHSAVVYLQVGHLLARVNGELCYQSCAHAVNWWQSQMSDVTPLLSLDAGWDLQYAPLLLPKDGWKLTVALTPSATPQYGKFGVCTPDGKLGVYIKWEASGGSYKWNLYSVVGTKHTNMTTGTTAQAMSDFTLEASTDVHAGIYASHGVNTLTVATNPITVPNMVIFTQGDDANGLTINSIAIEAAASWLSNSFNARTIGESGGSVSNLLGVGGLVLPTSGMGGLL